MTELVEGKDVYEVKANNCNCHPETCNHWDFYIFKEGERFIGSDDKKNLYETVTGLKKTIGNANGC